MVKDRSCPSVYKLGFKLTNMKIRLTSPKWLQQLRVKQRLQRRAKTSWWEDLPLTNIISLFIVLLIGFSLVGPMSDALSEANPLNATNMQTPIVFDIVSNKFFLLLMFTGIPMWMLWKLTKVGEYY